MTMRLRDLIKEVRNCKTAADERAVVNKECAAIRTAFKEEDSEYRHRNVAKLLYMHMLGYPTHYGQMECLKLITSPSYPDKRVGYLGLMLLLDERQEVLMLATHSIKRDLDHPNQYVVGLALCAVANISSAEIARDAASDVQKLLGSSNPYIRKKAALCAIRIIRKVPEILENFVPRIKSLLTERNHGVLLTGITLMIELCELDPSVVKTFRKLVPSLVRILKNLVMSGYAPEYDVQGISDPFLQVKILQLMALLGKGNTEASDAMNDILAQVATNTEGSRNVGHAILYQCVQTIMSIESESGLRVLAINILGRFLLNRDNNIRYVALNTLTKVVSRDFQAVQRHTNTIVACLNDSDVSIRRRALDLVYALVTRDTVRPLVREMLTFLATADHEIRPDLTTKICTVTERFAPNKRWHIDTIVRVMSMPGQSVQSQVLANLVNLIASSPELQPYAVGKLYLALQADIKPQPLVQVAVWCIGEYGELLVAGPIETKDKTFITVTEDGVLDLLQQVLRDATTDLVSREYCLTALMKLTTRYPSSLARIQAIIDSYAGSLDVELQQRSCEYVNIFARPDNEALRAKLLEHMPAPEDVQQYEREADEIEDEKHDPASTQVQPNDPLGLMKELFGDALPTGGPAKPPTPGMGAGLEGLLGGPVVPITGHPGGNSLLELLSEPAPPTHQTGLLDPVPLAPLPVGASTSAPTSRFPSMTAFQKNGLTLVFDFDKPAPNITVIQVSATNSTPTPMTNFSLLAAVPRYLQLTVRSPSGNVVPPNAASKVTQEIRLDNTMHGQKPVMLKIKVEYNIGGTDVVDDATIQNFPSGI